MARLIWGPGILKKARLARELLKRAIHFYDMLFPGLTGGGRVVDFGDAKILNAMFRIFNDNVRNKTVNPEFAFYARAEMGTATVSRVVGPVDVAVGDTLSYQVLRSDADPRGWLSVEAWPSGFVDVSVGRFWPVDRIISKQSLNR